MKELLPVVFGVVVGLATSWIRSRRAQAVVFPVASVGAGAAASAINGELASEAWAAFVSFDALLVWLTGAIVLGTVWSLQRLRAA